MFDGMPGYKIKGKIYEGNRFTFFRGYDEEKDCAVILKVLKKVYPTPEEIAYLKREYEVLRSLSIPGVIKPHGFEKLGSHYAIILEDFPGVALRAILDDRKRKINLRKSLDIGIKIAEILGEIHKQSIIHKDINPKNILYDETTKEVKIINFNRASILARENPGDPGTSTLEGTLPYMSPEQTGRMSHPVDYRSDYYSLGVTFYELLTGHLPFKGSDVMELVHCHLAKSPIAPHELKHKIPVVISNIVMRLLAKMADDRYQSAFGLVSDLKKCLRLITDNETIEYFGIGKNDVSAQFLFPGKLYGREKEMARLEETFRWANKGAAELVLVTGEAGIGKTALISRLYKPITVKRGYFLPGKFEQMKRNIPYSSMIQVFREFIKQLLTESEEKINSWKEKLLKVLGKNGRIIIDVIPEVELIIGPQPPVPELPSQESQNRFKIVFQDFVRTFASQDRPLVLFLDDLQWADSASLNLLEIFMTNPDIKHILFIGAYRENEVDDTHPLMLMLNRIREEGGKIHSIRLEPLQNTAVNQLISGTLKCSLAEAKPLAELCSKKTGGNPLFLKELLTFFYKEGLINFNNRDGIWQWESVIIEKTGISDNVVELMTGHIRKLPEDTQQILKLASCIGSRFDLYTLAITSRKNTEGTMACLWPALQEQLILPLDDSYKLFLDDTGLHARLLYKPDSFEAFKQGKESYFRFSHDRLQQAAYDLIPEAERKQVHLEIGQLLLQSVPEEQREERIFVILNQLNPGIKLLAAQSDREELARLNLMGGKKAKTSMAYQQAFRYLLTGLELLSEDCWQRVYDLTLDLHVEAAEAAYLSGDFRQMQKLATAVLKNALTMPDKVKMHEIVIEALIAQNRPGEAVREGLKVLKLLGVRLPERPGKLRIILALLRTKIALTGKEIANLTLLPEMKDMKLLLLMRIFARLISSTYLVQPELFALITLKLVHLSLKHGNSYVSGFAYVCYAIFLCGKLGDIESGYRFGKMVLDLIKRLDAREFKSRIILAFGHFIEHWKEPIRNNQKTFLTSYQNGLEIGDLEFACWSLEFSSTHPYFCGQELHEVECEMYSHLTAVNKLKQEIPLIHIKISHQVVLNLMEESKYPCALIGKSFDESKMLPRLIRADNRVTVFFAFFNKLFLSLLFREYSGGIYNRNNAEKYLESMIATLYYLLFHFYDSLLHLAIYAEADKKERKVINKLIAKNQKKMKKWAGHAPMNYMNKFYLVEAERCRVSGNDTAAAEFYDQSIQLAKEQGFIHEEALANELAGSFYLFKNKERIAGIYIKEAYYCYKRWGARAKLRDLEKRYPYFISNGEIFSGEKMAVSEKESGTLLTKPSGSICLEFLDLTTIIKAAQTISGEIVLSRLLEKMMKIVIENAGAEKGFLLLEREGKLLVEAEGFSHNNEVEILKSIPLEKKENLSREIVNYTARAKEIVVINDAVYEGRFRDTPYIRTNKPKSILCLPLINQDKLTGVLYLENNMSTHTFTQGRIHVLKTLAVQAAISVENALLYEKLEVSKEELQKHREHLEELVEDRTIELVERNHELEIINQMVKAINREIEFEKLLYLLLEQAFGLFPQAEMGSFLIYDKEKERFYVAVFEGFEPGIIENLSFTYDEAISRYTEGTEQLEEGVFIIRKFKGIAGADKLNGLPVPKSLLAMAITTAGKPEGFLVLESMTEAEAFDHSDIRKLLRFREHAVSAFIRAKTFKLLHQSLNESEAAHEIIKEKNLKIMNSMRYAERIQKAILPTGEKIKKLLKDHFIIFKPKDIVSGDFYWFSQAGDRVLLAAVDCTGHGVPGALLSMIGNILLDEFVSINRIFSPALILEELHINIRKILKQESEYLHPNDGMEVCLCMLEPKRKKLTFAGAKRPLYWLRTEDAELIEIKGDRWPIGGMQREQKRTFTNRVLSIESGDVIYLTSDGFADQNNKEDKKFGSKKLKELLKSSGALSMKKQKERLIKELQRHQGKEEQRDDILLIAVKI